MSICTGKRCPMQVGYDIKSCKQEDCPFRDTPVTNFDRIKNRSIDEVVEYIFEIDDKLLDLICKKSYAGECPYGDSVEPQNCKDCIKRWLESEVAE